MEKQTLRNEIRIAASALSADYLKTAGAAIQRRVIESAQFRRSEAVFVYVSTAREPETRGIIEAAWAAGKRVYVPKCGENRTMRALRLRAWEELTPGAFGIPEPPADAEEAQRLDLAIVPCLAASEDGARLGHGGGYYDRFLQKTTAETVCLCFEKLLRAPIPVTPLDVWMDAVATEERICVPADGGLRMDYEIKRLTEHPALAERMADWFSSKWKIPREAYAESMAASLQGAGPVPDWYVAMAGDEIIGGLGIIENDFHDRKDLAPNVCAVFTEPGYRCRGVARALLRRICDDMAAAGIGTLYLLTDHTSFYERCGWRFYCMAQGDGEEEPSRLYIHERP